jgi:predicted transcriptional regulator
MKNPAAMTAGEFELMEILWRVGEASVKQVWEHVEPGRNLAYTTVMTVLDKMRRKGLVVHRKQGRAYYYQPAVDRKQALEAVVDSVIRTYFGGSRAAFLQFLTGDVRSARVLPHAPAEIPAAGPAADPGDIDEFLL